MNQWLKIVCLVFILGLAGVINVNAKESKTPPRHSSSATPSAAKLPEAKLGWRLAMQAWSLNQSTFYETMDQAAALGFRYLEAFPGQPLAKEHPGVAFNHGLRPELRSEVLARLKAKGLKLIDYGVVDLGPSEAHNREVFEFCKAMGITTIVSEPPAENLAAVDKLCQEYKINVAIHNHPHASKSPYWDPAILLRAVQGCSARVGACADIGHWMRSGLDPLASLKMLKGRVLALHMKDVSQRDMNGFEKPWGTGGADIPALLAELKRQGFKGVITMEYESGPYYEKHISPVPEMARSVAFFRQTAARMAMKAPEEN
jgi:sugar phosphate isomerase/epimerase